MQLIDTHTHLYLEDFDNDRKETIQRAINAGVEFMFLPNIDSGTHKAMMNLRDTFPDNCFPMIGLHPTSIDDNYIKELNFVEKELAKNKYIAIGEIGIDLYWDKTYQKQQEEALRIQLEWAEDLNLPVAVHVRESFDEVFAILDKVNTPRLKGVFHSFTGNYEQAQKALSYEFMIGVGGIFTFKNSGLDKVIGKIDTKHLILETDSPYLAPTPMRGKRNESAFLVHIAQKLADINKTSLENIAEITSTNALGLFSEVKAFI